MTRRAAVVKVTVQGIGFVHLIVATHSWSCSWYSARTSQVQWVCARLSTSGVAPGCCVASSVVLRARQWCGACGGWFGVAASACGTEGGIVGGAVVDRPLDPS